MASKKKAAGPPAPVKAKGKSATSPPPVKGKAKGKKAGNSNEPAPSE